MAPIRAPTNRRLALLVEPEHPPEEAADDGADDAEQRRHDPAAGVLAGHDSFASAPTIRPKTIQPRIPIITYLLFEASPTEFSRTIFRPRESC